MRFKFHPQALEEFEQAVVYYEQRQPGLGERFSSSIESAIEGIVAAPDTWPVLEGPVRRRLARVFPYAVLYAELPEYILITAVMHCHQKPGYWRSRIGEKK